MPKINRVYLDLDNVLCDWWRAALSIHKLDHLLTAWPRGVYGIEQATGISEREFYAPMNTFRFWSELPVLPWTYTLVREAQRLAPVSIVSRPIHLPVCLAGKMEWLRKHVAPLYGLQEIPSTMYHFTANKHELAAPDRLLIDDCDENIRLFSEAGGRTLLFPRWWNSQHANHDRAAEITFELLKHYRTHTN